MQDFLVLTTYGMAEALPAVLCFFIFGWMILKKLKVTKLAIGMAFIGAWIVSGIGVVIQPPDIIPWQWTLGVCLASVAFFTFTIGLSGSRRAP